MTTTTSTRVLLYSRPHGEPTSDNFRIETAVVPELADGEVLLRTIYLSLDPYMRGRMSDAKSYAAHDVEHGRGPGRTAVRRGEPL